MIQKIRICPNCKQPKHQQPSGQWTCKPCNARRRRELRKVKPASFMRKCKQCGKPIPQFRPNGRTVRKSEYQRSKFCSYKCCYSWRRSSGKWSTRRRKDAVYLPSPKQIQAECRRIILSLSESDRRARFGVFVPEVV